MYGIAKRTIYLCYIYLEELKLGVRRKQTEVLDSITLQVIQFIGKGLG